MGSNIEKLKEGLKGFGGALKKAPEELGKAAKEGYDVGKKVFKKAVDATDLGNIPDAIGSMEKTFKKKGKEQLAPNPKDEQ